MKFLKKFPSDFTKKKIFKKYSRRSMKNIGKKKIISKEFRPVWSTVCIKCLENCKLQHFQMESFRRMFLFYTKNGAKIIFKGSFSTPISKKPQGVRMGKGKGKLSHWVAEYKKNSIIIEVELNRSLPMLLKLCKKFKHKFPFKFSIFYRSKNILKNKFINLNGL